jgi:hypothetical protein
MSHSRRLQFSAAANDCDEAARKVKEREAHHEFGSATHVSPFPGLTDQSYGEAFGLTAVNRLLAYKPSAPFA